MSVATWVKPLVKKPIIIRRTMPECWPAFKPCLHDILRRIYAARGVLSMQDLNRDLSALHPYHSLLNIDQAVQLLANAFFQNHKIMIVGDFDADGATSTALAVKALKAFGLPYDRICYLVPNRFEYGYGLSPEIVKKAQEQEPNLIITVDNGISSHEGVALANKLGITVLITDHHLPGESLPEAAAIINPNQAEDIFPSKNLAGVGVIFYVMLALRARLRSLNWFEDKKLKEPNMMQFLDLVALGTVADLVPLDQNNLILVHWGIERIRLGKACAGIKALLQIAKRNMNQLTSSDLGFSIGPRLNAAGRLEDMSIGIACLLAEKDEEAISLASLLDGLNQERQMLERGMHEHAFKLLDQILMKQSQLPAGLCLFHPSWHQGIVGILASRVKEHVHRPVIVFTKVSETEIKGSARSIPGLHIRDILDEISTKNPGLISKFGGHAMAAGLSLNLSCYENFKKAFEDSVMKRVDPEILCGKIWTDGPLEPQEFTLELAQLLQRAGPWGQNFPEPLFDNEFILLDQRLLAGKYLKMLLKIPGTEHYLDAIAFKIEPDEWPDYYCKRIHAVYRLDINEYQGIRKLQLIVETLIKY